jgi:alpha-L-rhamnosidase
MNRIALTRRELLLAGLAGVSSTMAGRGGAAQAPAVYNKKDRGQDLKKTMIWASAPEPEGTHFVAFRKRFTLPIPPQEARLHLFADVRYLLWINGTYVERGPARFQPQGPEYDTIPVTPFLKTGSNVIIVLVMANASNGKMMHHAPGLTASLEAAGTMLVGTDATWKWSDQTRYREPHIDWGNEMDVVDTTAEDGDWTQPDYDDSAWENAALIDGTQWGPLSARRIPLLQDTPLAVKLNDQELPVTIAAGQLARFTTPHLVQAYTVIDFDADPDTKFELSYAHIPYTANPGRQTYISTDTHGFKDGTIKVTSGKITVHAFTLVERIYPFECVGRFHSSDPLLDKIWAMCARSLQVMSEDSYVDCADRERTEWMDDTPPCYDITQTAMAGPGENGGKVYGDSRLLEELLRRTALTLQPGGWVKAHTCSDRFDIHAKMEDRACDWVEGARLYYESTGSAAPIREIWPAVVAQMDYFLQRRSRRGLIFGREWVMWANPMGYETSEGAGLNAFVYKALVDAAFLAKVIGKTGDATRFAQAAKDLSAAFDRELWDEKEGTYYSGYDTPQAELPPGVQKGKIGLQPDWDLPPKPPTLPDNRIAPTVYPALIALDQEIVPAERRERVRDYVIAHPDLNPRIMFYYYYWKQLYAADRPDLDRNILDVMRRKWKAMADFPWQTSFEDFNVGSKAHCYGMFPGYFLSAYVLGVRRDAPVSQRRLLIEPRLGDLTSAEGVVVTEFGPVSVTWTVGATHLDFHVVIPDGVTTTVMVPQIGTKPHLTMNGKPVSARSQGRYLALTLGAGPHTGRVTFTPLPPPPPPAPQPIMTQTSDVSQAAFEADLVKNSLIGLGQLTYRSTILENYSNDGGGPSADALRNGTTHNGSGGPDTQNDGKTYRGYGAGDAVTFRLDTSHHPAGYDITKIATFAGHGDGRASQHYMVSVAFTSDLDKFAVLFPDASVDCDGGSSEIVLSNPDGGAIAADRSVKAEGVAAVRFDFRDGPLGFNVYREIQIVGHARA